MATGIPCPVPSVRFPGCSLTLSVFECRFVSECSEERRTDPARIEPASHLGVRSMFTALRINNLGADGTKRWWTWTRFHSPQNIYADEWVAKWSRALASSFGIDKWGV
jgi:hypothetical protein